MTDAAPPAAETDVILGDLGVLLLECGVSVTDVCGSLEQVGRRAASTPQASLEFAILPEMVMVSRPGAVWMTVSGVAMPFSIDSAAISGFIVEPGSNESVRARLRSCPPERFSTGTDTSCSVEMPSRSTCSRACLRMPAVSTRRNTVPSTPGLRSSRPR